MTRRRLGCSRLSGVRGAAHAGLKGVWGYVRSAPGTFVWLAILLITTLVMRQLPPGAQRRVIEWHSTNLHQLSHDPIRALISSALWIDGGRWWPYVFLYAVFHAPAERWLGTTRWLFVALFAHVGATYVSEGVVAWRIDHHLAPASERFVDDIGVSYALAGIQGVLVYFIASPWRYLYAAAVIGFYSVGLIGTPSFTAIGHMSAALLGMACYAVTLGRDGSWDPVAAVRRAWSLTRRSPRVTPRQ